MKRNRAGRFLALLIAVTMMLGTVAYGFDGVQVEADYAAEVVYDLVDEEEVVQEESDEYAIAEDDSSDRDYESDELLTEAEFTAAMFVGSIVFDFWELHDAVFNATVSEITVIVGADIDFLATIHIPAGLTVNLRSVGGPRVMSREAGALTRWESAFEIEGVLRLGIAEQQNIFGSIPVDNNITITGFNNRAIRVNSGGVFELHGGTISGNHAYNQTVWPWQRFPGGGVLVTNGTFNMYGGAIVSNSAEAGAGINLVYNSTFNMHGGLIAYNMAGAWGQWGQQVWWSDNGIGGAIGVETTRNGWNGMLDNSTINIAGGTIRNNSAEFGGAIGFYRDEGSIADVPFWDIYEALYDVSVSLNVRFENNMAPWVSTNEAHLMHENILFLNHNHRIHPHVNSVGEWLHVFNNLDIHMVDIYWSIYLEDNYLPDWVPDLILPGQPGRIARAESREGYNFVRWDFRQNPHACCCDESFSYHVMIVEEETVNGMIISNIKLPIILTPGFTLFARAIWTPADTGNRPDATANLARNYTGATMFASSVNEGARGSLHTNNGVRSGAVANNSWLAASAGEEWLQVNFGEVRNFNNVRIYQPENNGHRITDYRLEHSNDGVHWVEFHSNAGRMAGPRFEFTNETTIQAQFVRVVSARSFGVTPIAVFEFEVYYMP